MSTTEVKLLTVDEGVTDIFEFKNSHGTAPVIWDIMSQKYLGLKPFEYSYSNTDKLWPLWKDKNIVKHQRAVLAMTYDNVIVVKEDFARAAEDIKKFLEDFPVNPQYVNHWPKIQKIFEDNPVCDGIGFYWTSVSEDPFEGEWDEEKEEYGEINWNKFWSLYKQLDKFD